MRNTGPCVHCLSELFFAYDTLEVCGDQYQADAFGKILDEKGVSFTAEAWTAPRHRSVYGRLRSLIKQKKISLPRSDDLFEELSTLQVKYLPASGQYTITHKVGGHDDVADAVADVTWRLTEEIVMNPAGMEVI